MWRATTIDAAAEEGLLMLRGRFSQRRPRNAGYTLVELITVVLVLSILLYIAVPRLHPEAASAAQAEGAAQRLVTDLRHTRALAITHAARNPQGFSLVVPDPGPCRRYQVINEHNHTTVTTCTLAAGVQGCGPRRFQFGPLGNLRDGSDTHVCLRSAGRAYVIEVVPATGAVEWRPGSDEE
jgi:prepilin-type N-terminal cleavage/methylation domain-containing protein